VVRKIRYEEIWLALQNNFKVRFSQKLKNRLTPTEQTTLVGCVCCGLEYFVPIAPGDSEFYETFAAAPVFYLTEKWEFNVIKKHLFREAILLDVGCGEGAFLYNIRDNVKITIGVDFNHTAISRARASGIEAYEENISEFAKNNAERFDVVTCLQVIEHLPEVKPFLESVITCLKAGGMLILSVPNRDRYFKDPLEPLDCPPHHISHWDSRQWKILDELLGITLIKTEFEMFRWYDYFKYLRDIIRDKIYIISKKEIVHFKQKGLKPFRHSMIAYYRKNTLINSGKENIRCR